VETTAAPTRLPTVRELALSTAIELDLMEGPVRCQASPHDQ
jgi:hypothetical protein